MCQEFGCKGISVLRVDVQVDEDVYEPQELCEYHASKYFEDTHVCGTPFCYSCDRPDQ